MEGGCLSEQTKWRLKLENPSNQYEVERVCMGKVSEMTLTASSSHLLTRVSLIR